MRIIHTADLHLDSAFQANFTPEQARMRRGELLNTFRRLIEYAENNHVSAILLCGDLFDTKSPYVTTVNMVWSYIKTHPSISFYYLHGNHDDKVFQEGREDITNFYTFDEPWTQYSIGNVTITGAEMDSNGNIPYDELILNPDNLNLVLLHGDVNPRAEEHPIFLSRLQGKNIDYLALGHLHSYREEPIDNRGVYAYSGCLEGRGYDECGEKGFVLLDINEEAKTIEKTFVPFAQRTIYDLKVDITGCTDSGDITGRIETCLSENGITGNDEDDKTIAKITLTGEYPVENEKDLETLQSTFSIRFLSLRIDDTSTDLIIPERYQNDHSLKGEFIRRVLNAEDLTEEEKKKVIRLGIMSLRGDLR